MTNFDNILWRFTLPDLRYICLRLEIDHDLNENRGDLVKKITEEYSLEQFELVFPQTKTINKSTITTYNDGTIMSGKVVAECKTCWKP
jgi:hypothetical protein